MPLTPRFDSKGKKHCGLVCSGNIWREGVPIVCSGHRGQMFPIPCISLINRAMTGKCTFVNDSLGGVVSRAPVEKYKGRIFFLPD